MRWLVQVKVIELAGPGEGVVLWACTEYLQPTKLNDVVCGIHQVNCHLYNSMMYVVYVCSPLLASLAS